ncbi:hypothetical protein DMI62_08135 [Escherichia coli]|nr:hypothetical protein [Escherichia coli]
MGFTCLRISIAGREFFLRATKPNRMKRVSVLRAAV